MLISPRQVRLALGPPSLFLSVPRLERAHSRRDRQRETDRERERERTRARMRVSARIGSVERAGAGLLRISGPTVVPNDYLHSAAKCRQLRRLATSCNQRRTTRRQHTAGVARPRAYVSLPPPLSFPLDAQGGIREKRPAQTVSLEGSKEAREIRSASAERGREMSSRRTADSPRRVQIYNERQEGGGGGGGRNGQLHICVSHDTVTE